MKSSSFVEVFLEMRTRGRGMFSTGAIVQELWNIDLDEQFDYLLEWYD